MPLPPMGRPRGGSVTKKVQIRPCPPCLGAALRRVILINSEYFPKKTCAKRWLLKIGNSYYSDIIRYWQLLITNEG